MSRPFAERAASWTSAGRRQHNEDAVLIARLEPDRELIAVADGMGGRAAGDVASNRALEVLHSAIASGDDLVTAAHLANQAVYTDALTRDECRGMGTTLVAALRQDGRYTIVNAGDSRAYRVDDTGAHQLTQDNSFVAEAVRSGRMTAEQAESSPWRNAVTRCLGTDPEVDLDVYGPFEAAGHVLLLCTDGVYKAIDAPMLARIVADSPDADTAVRAITDAAYAAGSEDNIGVALVTFDTAAAPSPIARAPAPLIIPASERRRRHRVRPGVWTFVRIVLAGIAVIWTLVYVARTLTS